MTFEGVEKRLEITFDQNINVREKFRSDDWERLLEPVNCRIEDSLFSEFVDSYLLSASSLFVHRDTILIKTCGETDLFACIPGILFHAKEEPVSVKYTRGSYLWPERQPATHASISSEARILHQLFLKKLNYWIQEAFAHPNDKLSSFHFLGGSGDDKVTNTVGEDHEVTVEVLMKNLDRAKSSVFYDKGEKGLMTQLSGIDNIFAGSQICAFEFSPCGYSMNGILGHSVYTIHVTPEHDFSFASFEAFKFKFKGKDHLNDVISRVLHCFAPGSFTVSLHSKSESDLHDLQVHGRTCKFKQVKNLRQFGSMAYYSF